MRKDLTGEDLKRLQAKQGARCPLCGGELEYNPRKQGFGQWAHFLCATIPHRKRYGNKVIDSKFNGVMVCGLQCNNAVQLKYGPRPAECDDMAEWIKLQEAENSGY